MKKLFLLLFITIFFSGCERDYIRNNTLPPLTNTGENTAGCLVNGEVFLPKGFFPWAISSLSCKYGDGAFSLSIIQKKDNTIKSIGIFYYEIPLHNNIGLSYTLENYDQNQYSNHARYYIKPAPPPSPFFYSTTNIFVGELVLTYLNIEKRTISGTFWFDAVNSEGEVIEVRDGRFDMEY